ncbi:hypothetical protein M0805_004826 [Coniferiporia weirii]|nr:hypothetical protein M0805_004826 [Coniferiporia weirii]
MTTHHAIVNPQVSLNLRLTSGGESSDWFTALTIPHDLFSLYAVKPRKWLSYLGYAVTGSEGVLTRTQDKSIPCDMDAPVNAGDIYYFHSINAIHFVDPDVISTITSGHSSQSLSPIPNELIEQYGACPFSGFPRIHCHACYLVPDVKGDAYIQRVTEERSAGLTVIEKVDDIRNMLFLETRLHAFLDRRTIAFLPTPNVVLKTDDIVQGADPDAYLVTLHCFEQYDSDFLAGASHGKSAALPNENTRPPEVIYTMIYGSAALNVWAPPTALALVKQYTQDKYYPGDTRSRGREERGKVRRERKEKEARERCERRERRERLRNRNEDGSEELSQDEESNDFDMFDMMMAFRCATRRTSEGLEKAAEDERKKASVEKVQGWLMDH